jgi:hypothetical protein
MLIELSRIDQRYTFSLANLASRCFMNNVWLHSPPDCIAGIVQREYVTSNAMILNQ